MSSSGLPQIEPNLATRGGKVVQCMTWFLLVISSLAIIARVFAKHVVARRLGNDDAFAILALIFSIGSAAATSIQVSNGLGQHGQFLEESSIVSFYKSNYATELLYLAVLCCAKLSIISLLILLSPTRKHHIVIHAVGVAIGIWWISSGFAVAFQCPVPDTWNIVDSSCIDRVSLWYYIASFSIISDILLVTVPFYIIQGLQMRLRKKVIILASFGTRIFDVVAVSTQISFTNVLASSDLTYHLWPWVLILQIAQCVTIVTSCIPYLRQLLETIPSGLYMSDELRRRRGRNDSTAYGSNGTMDGSNPRPEGTNCRPSGRKHKDMTLALEAMANTNGENLAEVSAHQGESDNASYNSLSQILKTTTFGLTGDEA